MQKGQIWIGLSSQQPSVGFTTGKASTTAQIKLLSNYTVCSIKIFWKNKKYSTNMRCLHYSEQIGKKYLIQQIKWILSFQPLDYSPSVRHLFDPFSISLLNYTSLDVYTSLQQCCPSQTAGAGECRDRTRFQPNQSSRRQMQKRWIIRPYLVSSQPPSAFQAHS